MNALYRRFRDLIHEVAKFGVVGIVAYAITLGTFNALRFGGPDGQGVLYERPLTAQGIAVVVATTFAYFANRHWTWADRERTGLAREYFLFFFINGVSLVMALALLSVSHYGLGLTSPLADNISANGIGLVLGTLFRFWAYRRWVFPVSGEASSVAATVPSAGTVPAP